MVQITKWLFVTNTMKISWIRKILFLLIVSIPMLSEAWANPLFWIPYVIT